MVDDVRLATNGRTRTRFYGRMGGIVPFPDEILGELQKMNTELKEAVRDAVDEEGGGRSGEASAAAKRFSIHLHV